MPMSRTLEMPSKKDLKKLKKLKKLEAIQNLPHLQLPNTPSLPSLPSPSLPTMPHLPHVKRPSLPNRDQLPDFPTLNVSSLPSLRKKKKTRKKFIPILIIAAVIALLISNRRGKKPASTTSSSGSQPWQSSNSTVSGTAPAGAQPMPERDLAAATTTSSSKIEPTPATSTPGTTSDAMMGITSAPGQAVTEQPSPIADEDAPGSESPDDLFEDGLDLGEWVDSNRGDTDTEPDTTTDTGSESDATSTAAASDPLADGINLSEWVESNRADNDADASETTPSAPAAADEAGGGTGNDLSEFKSSDRVPTPAAETTAAVTSGDGWIKVDHVRECPSDFPIKGNANSRIYHTPGSRMYDPTIPEMCFATEEVAQALGYRAPKG